MNLSVEIDVYYIYGNISRIYHKVNASLEKIQKLNFSDTFLYKKKLPYHERGTAEESKIFYSGYQYGAYPQGYAMTGPHSE